MPENTPMDKRNEQIFGDKPLGGEPELVTTVVDTTAPAADAEYQQLVNDAISAYPNYQVANEAIHAYRTAENEAEKKEARRILQEYAAELSKAPHVPGNNVIVDQINAVLNPPM